MLVDAGTGKVIAKNVWYARTFWARFLGLMGRRSMPEDTALVIEPCNAVHTFFMRFPIDVFYFDAEGRVIKHVKKLKPWRVGPWARKARMVAEMVHKELNNESAGDQRGCGL